MKSRWGRISGWACTAAILVVLVLLMVRQVTSRHTTLDEKPPDLSMQQPEQEAPHGPLLTGSAPPPDQHTSDLQPPLETKGDLASVTCIRSDTGASVPGALVFTATEETAFAKRTDCGTTGDDGVATISIGPNMLFLHAVAEGYLPTSVPVAPGVHEYELRLGQGRVVHGRAVDHRGRGVRGVFICAYAQANAAALGGLSRASVIYSGERGTVSTARTDAEGEFVLRGLPPMELDLWASKDGWYPKSPVVRLPANESRVELHLVPVTVVTIDLVDAESGLPLNPVVPRVVISVPPGMMTLPWHLARTDSVIRGVQQASLRGKRTYVIVPRVGLDWKGSTRDAVKLRAVLFSAGFHRLSQTHSVAIGSHTNIAMKVQMKTSRARSVQVEARYSDGLGFNGTLDVDITDLEGGPLGHATLDFAEGVAQDRLRLPLGRYRLTPRGAAANPGMRHEFWEPAGSPGEVDLEHSRGVARCTVGVAGGQVELEVVDSTGAPVRGYSLGLSREGEVSRGDLARWDMHGMLRQGADGGPARFWLPPGQSTLRASLPGVGRGTAEVLVPDSGQLVKCRLVLR